MSKEELKELIMNGDVEGVVRFFDGMPKKARKDYVVHINGVWRRVTSGFPDWREHNPDQPEAIRNQATESNQSRDRRIFAAGMAKLEAGPVSGARAAFKNIEFARVWLVAYKEGNDELLENLKVRHAGWLQKYVDESVKQEDFRPNWPLIYELIKAGLAERPDDPEYYRQFAFMPWYYARRDSGGPEQFLRDNPELLEHELWRLFEIDEAISPTLRDWGNRDWSKVLLALTTDGTVDRSRVIDALLHALLRDFKDSQAWIYIDIHNALEPSLEELASRQDAYVALFHAPANKAVKLGVDSLKALLKAGKLKPQAVLDDSATALKNEQKGVVKSMLTLLKSIGHKHKKLKPEIALAATEALSHEASDLQERAFKLIEDFGRSDDTALAEAVRSLLEDVTPGLRNGIASWLGEDVPPVEATASIELDVDELRSRIEKLPDNWVKLAGVPADFDAVDPPGLPPVEIDRMAIPALDPDARFEPIQDVEELVEEATAIIEEPRDVDQIERILDGIARLGLERPKGFDDLTAQLRKRLDDENRLQSSASPLGVEGLIKCWLDGGALSGFLYGVHAAAEFFLLRCSGIAYRLHHEAANPLLSTPTHRGGWIDSRVAVDRARAMIEEDWATDVVDWAQGFLRLSPEHRKEALESARDLAGEGAAALRYAIGGDEEIGDSETLWAAASRARNPKAADEKLEARFPGLGRDLAQQPEYSWEIRDLVEYGSRELWLKSEPASKIDLRYELVTGKAHTDPTDFRTHQMHRTWDYRVHQLTWPMNSDWQLFQGVRAIGTNIDWLNARWEQRAVMEVLLHPDCEMGQMATLLLSMALSCKEPGEAGLATDILIAAIEDGRVTGEMLCASMGPLLKEKLLKPNRLEKTLGDAARVSPLHAREVRKMTERMLADLLDEKPRNLHGIVDLLHQLTVTSGTAPENTDTVEFLQQQKGSSKLAKAARKLLKLKPDPDNPHDANASAQAIQARIERAERWDRWSRGEPDGEEG